MFGGRRPSNRASIIKQNVNGGEFTLNLVYKEIYLIALAEVGLISGELAAQGLHLQIYYTILWELGKLIRR